MKKELLIALIIVFASICVQSQTIPRNSFRITHLHTEVGLPQNAVGFVKLDAKGNLWIGTHNGLACYNGISMKINFIAKTAKRIADVYEDPNGGIYIIDHNFNVYYANPDNREIYRLPLFGKSGVHSFFSMQTGMAISDFEYASTIAKWLKEIKYPLANRPYFHFSSTINKPQQQHTLFAIDQGKFIPEIKTTSPFEVYTYQQQLLLYSPNQWLLNYHPTTKKIDTITGITGPEFAHENLNSLLAKGKIYQQKNMLLFYFARSVYYIEIRSNQIKFNLIYRQLPIVQDIAQILYHAESKSVIISSSSDGIYFIRPSRFANKPVSANKDEPYAYNIIDYNDKGLLSERGYVIPYANTQHPDKLLSIEGSFLYKDAQAKIWYTPTSRPNTLVCATNTGKIIKQYIAANDMNLIACSIDSGEKKYVANAHILYQLTKQDSVFAIPAAQFTNIEINGLHAHTTDSLWILTNNGIYVYLPQLQKLAAKVLLKGVYCRKIFPTQNNAYWLATYGNGYYYYHNGKFTVMPLDNHKNLLSTHAFLEDSLGYVWMSTNNGIVMALRSSLINFVQGKTSKVYYHHFSKSFGFHSNELNGNGLSPCVIDKQGNFNFTSMNGIIQFNPYQIQPLLPNHPITIICDYIDDKYQIDYTQKNIDLSPQFKRIHFTVEDVYYGNNSNYKLEYCIFPTDTIWRSIRENNFFIHTLSPGSYQIKVRKPAGFASNFYVQDTITISVNKYFWQQWWFLFILLLAGFSFIYIVAKVYAYRIQLQKDYLKRKIRISTSKLRESNVALTRLIKRNEIITSIIAHDIKGPIKIINEVSGMMKDNWQQIKDSSKHKANEDIFETTLNISEFLQQLLIWLTNKKIQPVEFKEFNLHDLIEQTSYFTLKASYERKSILLVNHIPQDFIILSNLQILKIIVSNIIDNAIKYSYQGTIQLSAHADAHFYYIQCTDNGIGMSKEKIEELSDYDISYENLSTSTDQHSYHLGYYLINELSPLIHCTCKIQSEPKQGTTITLQVKKQT